MVCFGFWFFFFFLTRIYLFVYWQGSEGVACHGAQVAVTGQLADVRSPFPPFRFRRLTRVLQLGSGHLHPEPSSWLLNVRGDSLTQVFLLTEFQIPVGLN